MTSNKEPSDKTNPLVWLRLTAVTLTVAGVLLTPSMLLAQKGGGGSGASKAGNSTESKQDKKDEEEANKPKCPEIVGKHLLLEKMTEDFGLTCAQEDKIEPLLHDEESVSKPLLGYDAFTPEEKQAMMVKIKLAARVQIRPLLTPDQQKKSDAEAASVAAAGAEPKKGGKKGATPKKVTAQADPFKGEEELSAAIAAYSAFSVADRKTLIIQVKQAAMREGSAPLTADQTAKLNADLVVLQKP